MEAKIKGRKGRILTRGSDKLEMSRTELSLSEKVRDLSSDRAKDVCFQVDFLEEELGV